MPREVWGYEEDIWTTGPLTGQSKGTVTQTPRKDFTPKRDPISTKYTDPNKYKSSPTLKSSTQGLVGRNPHVDSTWGKPATGIQYTPHQATQDATSVIQGNRSRDRDDTVKHIPYVPRGGNGGEETENGGEEETGAEEEETETEEEEEEEEEETETETGNGDNGEGPSLTTINKPDQTPSLRELTSDMDLRNMLGNILNQNNPLFKQARTRAYQAMRARGMPIDSSMTNDLVMKNIMDVAMPIATRVIDDLQRVMKERADASDAFKMAMNQAYYQELLVRVDAANKWNLQRMMESGLNWREMLAAKSKGADAATAPVFDRYMDMISKNTGGSTGLSGFGTV